MLNLLNSLGIPLLLVRDRDDKVRVFPETLAATEG